MAHVHEAVELAEWFATEEPAEMAAAGVVALVAGTVLTLLCCLAHQRRMRVQIRKLEKELGAAREIRREALAKASGEGEGEQLASGAAC